MEILSDWSALISDVLVEITKRVSSLEDFMALRGVCSSWRTAVTKDKFIPSSPRVPLLLLPENSNGEREFYSLSKRKICMRLSIPELKGKQCVEAGFGWLLTFSESGDVTLLNPFSDAQIQLPNFRSFRKSQGYISNFIEKAVLSENPSQTSNFVVMTIPSGGGFVAILRPGDVSWRRIKSRDAAFMDVVYCHGKFYATNTPGGIWIWDGKPTANVKAVRRIPFPLHRFLTINRQIYIVKSSLLNNSNGGGGGGDLLVIMNNLQPREEDKLVDEFSTKFTMYRVVDIMKGDWERIFDLGNNAIFVGSNASVSIPVAETERSGIKANCIYFTDDFWIGIERGSEKNIGIYNVGDQSVKSFHGVGEPLSFISPPAWFFP